MCVFPSTCVSYCIRSVPSLSQQLRLSSSPTFPSRLDPQSIFPSDLLQRIASRRVYAKWSAVAKPPIWTFDQTAPLFMSLRELISYLMKKPGCQSLHSKNFLALPPLLATLAESLFPPHPPISSSIAALRGLRVGVSSLCCPVCLAFFADM